MKSKEGNGDDVPDPIYYVLRYVSEKLEPETNATFGVDLSPAESIAFIQSLGASGFKIEKDETNTRLVNPQWRTRIAIKELHRETSQIDVNLRELIEEGIDSESVIEYYVSDQNGFQIQEDTRNKIGSMSDLNVFDEFVEVLFAQKLSDRILPFLSMSQVLIERYSIELLNQELMSDTYSETNRTIEFLEDLSQPTREQLIQRTELLEGHIISNMSQVRNRRNDVIHGLRGSEYLDEITDSRSDLNRCIDVIVELESALEIGDGFVWRSE